MREWYDLIAHADPRGPNREIVAVDHVSVEHPHATLVTFTCGHVRELNPTICYRIGHVRRCFACALQDNKQAETKIRFDREETE